MRQLIYKEFIIWKIQIIVLTVFQAGIFALVVLLRNYVDIIPFVTGMLFGIIWAQGFLFPWISCSADDKNRFDITLNSLALSRSSIVKAKYITNLLIALIYYCEGILLLTASYLIQEGNIYNFSVKIYFGIIISFLIQSLIMVVFYPVYYKWNIKIASLIITVLFVMILISGFYVLNVSSINFEEIILNIPKLNATISSIIFSSALILMSMFLSIKFYNNKDL